MDIQPSDFQELASLESRLEVGDLTLGAIRGIEDEMLLATDEKTRKLGGAVLVRIWEKRKVLIEKEIAHLEGNTDIGSKILRLKLLNSEQSLDETQTEVLAISREVPLEEDAHVQETVRKQLEGILFAESQPLICELDDESLVSNFASRMRQVAKAIVEQHSLAPFQGLNEVQKREVYRYARGG